MTNVNVSLKQRLDELDRRLKQKQKKLEKHSHPAAGQHIGHLVEFGKEQEELKRRLEQPGLSPEQRADTMIEADFNSLLDRFDRWVRYVDEEFDQMR